MIRVTIITLAFLILVPQQAFANYCLCTDIQTQSLCSNQQNYDGICYWDNGLCYEKNCEQRLTQSQCEADQGTFWCGWVDRSSCVTPKQCSDISVQKWCLRSGCQWISKDNSDADNELSTSGGCFGPSLNSISCTNLNAEQCTNYDYFYNYATDTYEKCFLDLNNNCVIAKTCALYSSEANCDQKKCKWNSDVQECEVKSCIDIKNQTDCQRIIGDQSNIFMCEWNSSKDLCQALSCSDIRNENQCNFESVGLNGGAFCQWTNGKCNEVSCLDVKSQEECLQHSYFDGGFSTCTWLNDDQGGFCYTCNNPPSEQLSYQSIISSIFAMSLIMIQL